MLFLFLKIMGMRIRGADSLIVDGGGGCISVVPALLTTALPFLPSSPSPTRDSKGQKGKEGQEGNPADEQRDRT